MLLPPDGSSKQNKSGNGKYISRQTNWLSEHPANHTIVFSAIVASRLASRSVTQSS